MLATALLCLVLLALLTSSRAYKNPACSPVIMLKNGQYTPAGLTEYGGPAKQEDCLADCITSSTCLSCDWNVTDATCWFGTTQNPTTASSSDTNHYDLFYPNSCNKTVSSCPIVTETNNQHMAIAVWQGPADSRTAMNYVAECLASPTCLAIDWSTGSEECWFETAPNPLLFPTTGVVHYDVFYPDDCNTVDTGPWWKGYLPMTSPAQSLEVPHGIACARLCLATAWSPQLCIGYALLRDTGTASGLVECLIYEVIYPLQPNASYVTYIV